MAFDFDFASKFLKQGASVLPMAEMTDFSTGQTYHFSPAEAVLNAWKRPATMRLLREWVSKMGQLMHMAIAVGRVSNYEVYVSDSDDLLGGQKHNLELPNRKYIWMSNFNPKHPPGRTNATIDGSRPVDFYSEGSYLVLTTANRAKYGGTAESLRRECIEFSNAFLKDENRVFGMRVDSEAMVRDAIRLGVPLQDLVEERCFMCGETLLMLPDAHEHSLELTEGHRLFACTDCYKEHVQ